MSSRPASHPSFRLDVYDAIVPKPERPRKRVRSSAPLVPAQSWRPIPTRGSRRRQHRITVLRGWFRVGLSRMLGGAALALLVTCCIATACGVASAATGARASRVCVARAEARAFSSPTLAMRTDAVKRARMAELCSRPAAVRQRLRGSIRRSGELLRLSDALDLAESRPCAGTLARSCCCAAARSPVERLGGTQAPCLQLRHR